MIPVIQGIKFVLQRSNNIYGPYETPEDNRVTQPSEQFFGTGHASMTEYKENWYLVYHRLINPDCSLLRETCISQINFINGNPIVDVDKQI